MNFVLVRFRFIRFIRLLELKRLRLKINCFVSLAGCWFSIAAPLLSLIPLQTY